MCSKKEAYTISNYRHVAEIEQKARGAQEVWWVSGFGLSASARLRCIVSGWMLEGASYGLGDFIVHVVDLCASVKTRFYLLILVMWNSEEQSGTYTHARTYTHNFP